jgi:hypothetical protein
MNDIVTLSVLLGHGFLFVALGNWLQGTIALIGPASGPFTVPRTLVGIGGAMLRKSKKIDGPLGVGGVCK